MTKNHDFVYSVKHLKGLNNPVIPLCSEQQITDIKRFFGTWRTVLGVGKTYNLGDFHVTSKVYKDLSVLKRSTRQHPISFGPMFPYPLDLCLHTNSSTNRIADNMTDEEIKNMISDKKEAFKVAMNRCLPGSTHTLCTRHLRENTKIKSRCYRKVTSGWSNNNCESANYIMRSAADWKNFDIY
jgi:hypothetical protein